MKEDERTGTEGDGGRDALNVGGRETWGCWRTWHGDHRPTKEGDNVSKGQYSEASKGYHSRTRVSAPRPPAPIQPALIVDNLPKILSISNLCE